MREFRALSETMVQNDLYQVMAYIKRSYGSTLYFINHI